MENDIIKRFTAFCVQFLLISPKKAKTHSFTKNLLDHLTSYLVTIATYFHDTCAKMCLRDMPTATVNGRY